jgi:primosomal protein N'
MENPDYSIDDICKMGSEEFLRKVTVADIREIPEYELRAYVRSQDYWDLIRALSSYYLCSGSEVCRALLVRNHENPTDYDFAVVDFVAAMVIEKGLPETWFNFSEYTVRS